MADGQRAGDLRRQLTAAAPAGGSGRRVRLSLGFRSSRPSTTLSFGREEANGHIATSDRLVSVAACSGRHLQRHRRRMSAVITTGPEALS